MNYETIAAILIVAVFISIVGATVAKDIRHAYLVPEGYVGLLYHKGKFVEVLGAGRHIRWGRHFTLGVNDLRKTSLLVAGQDVLTADNVSLKLSLLVTY
ncbi:MAG TPA: SPFH domain-containing protein, partial [Verrucomicrobiae bacterium]